MMMPELKIFSFVLLFSVDIVLSSLEVEILEGKRLYKGYQVLRAYPKNITQRDHILLLEDDVDFWSEMGDETSKVDFMVEPLQQETVRSFLFEKGLDFEVVIEDVQARIDVESNDVDVAEGSLTSTIRDKRQHKLYNPLGFLFNLPLAKENNRRRRRPVDPVPNPQHLTGCAKTGMNWHKYQAFETMMNWLNCLETTHPDKVTLLNIGKSVEGRPLVVVALGNAEEKPAVFIDGGMHAREWASPAGVTYLIHRLVEEEGGLDRILENVALFILPMANPDGYEYSRNHDRMWRKTRARTGAKNFLGQVCHGVDPNRNFGYGWGGHGASEQPCKETYRGRKAFSEPETRAIRDFILGMEAQFKLYLTFHSYGQYILFPWGYDKLTTSDHRELKRVGMAAYEALRKENAATYEVGSAAIMLYPASGGSDDWAKGGAGIKYSYTVELPDTGDYGFLLPPRYIKKAGSHVITVLESMVGEVAPARPKRN